MKQTTINFILLTCIIILGLADILSSQYQSKEIGDLRNMEVQTANVILDNWDNIHATNRYMTVTNVVIMPPMSPTNLFFPTAIEVASHSVSYTQPAKEWLLVWTNGQDYPFGVVHIINGIYTKTYPLIKP